jgi:hypothetical protein
MIPANDPVTVCREEVPLLRVPDSDKLSRRVPSTGLAAGNGWRNHITVMIRGSGDGFRGRDHAVRRGGALPMSLSEDADPSEQRAAARPAAATTQLNRVTFNRLELHRILNLYGRMVADGEWRDYAIDFLRDRAVFSVYRRASEVPIYRIEKDPRLARKQGMYSVISATGLILRRGHELERVLLVIDRKLAVV